MSRATRAEGRLSAASDGLVKRPGDRETLHRKLSDEIQQQLATFVAVVRVDVERKV
jgi:hypothetical protein